MTDGRIEEMLGALNPAQRLAAMHVDGPILILAGAGSGKTRVLTTRIARLILAEHVEPSQILAVTFTNKAAGEMRQRLERALTGGPRLAGMWVGTFHSIGARMLRAAAHLVKRTASYTIYDQDDQLAVIKRLMDRHQLSPKQFAPRALQSAISDAKNSMVPPDEYAGLARDPLTKAAAAVYGDLSGELQRANAVDFDDLLLLPVQLLRQHPEQLAAYRQRFRHVLVDEYQDTNRAQYQLIRLLGGEHGNVCVVGDDDQSIYGWRGADIRNILDFSKDFPSAAVVRLEENYRSAPPILEVANAVIAANTSRMGKTLRATRGGGDSVTVLRSLDERDEADWVANEVSSRRNGGGDGLRDVAVLYRTNAQSRAFEEAFDHHRIPCRLIGAVRFYDRREIRDLLSYLKLIANPRDDEALRRAVAVPKRGMGETSVDMLAEVARREGLSLYDGAGRPDLVAVLRPAARTALKEFRRLIEEFRDRAERLPVNELLRDLAEAIKYGDYLRAEGPDSAERLDNVRELITRAAEFVADELGEIGMTPLDHFLQQVSLIADVDSLDAAASAVTLMTLHNAKGLEFPVVFISGLEDGLFPLARAYDEPDLLEEERRLFYVGITRAEDKLYLTFAEERRRNGEVLRAKPSSFLASIPELLLEKRQTIKVRSAGRAFMSGNSWRSRRGEEGLGQDDASGRNQRAFLAESDDMYGLHGGPARDREAGRDASAAPTRRRGSPLSSMIFADEHASQDVPTIEVGARVRHRKFGVGTIAELSGSGRATKARVDFDDETVGRKTLVVAQANLEPEGV